MGNLEDNGKGPIAIGRIRRGIGGGIVGAIVGGIVGFFASSLVQSSIVYLLLFASGSFIYIAAADLIPSIRQEAGLYPSIMHFAIFLTGIALMLVIR